MIGDKVVVSGEVDGPLRPEPARVDHPGSVRVLADQFTGHGERGPARRHPRAPVGQQRMQPVPFRVSLLGQQVTDLESPFQVERGQARLRNIRGKLLGGEVNGEFAVTLDATPHYSARLGIQGVDLQRYADTLPGRQSFRGFVAV